MDRHCPSLFAIMQLMNNTCSTYRTPRITGGMMMNETIKKNAWDTNGYMDRSHVADARTAPEEECFDGAIEFDASGSKSICVVLPDISDQRNRHSVVFQMTDFLSPTHQFPFLSVDGSIHLCRYHRLGLLYEFRGPSLLQWAFDLYALPSTNAAASV